MVKPHVNTGCRDCKRCTNSKVANAGRDTGRVLAGVYSLRHHRDSSDDTKEVPHLRSPAEPSFGSRLRQGSVCC